MAFLKAVGDTMKSTANNAASSTAKVLYGVDEPEQKAYPLIYADHLLMNRDPKKVELMFKFGGSMNLKTAHWMVLIYEKGSNQCTKCHYTRKGVGVEVVELRKDTKWKQHAIKSRNYSEIINWCKGYQDKNANYNPIEANCRKFSIRLAEYCNIPTTEINWIVSSQYYTATDVVKDTINSGKDVVNGNIVKGVSSMGTSVVKNTAKIVHATGNQVIDTTKDTTKSVGSGVESVVNMIKTGSNE